MAHARGLLVAGAALLLLAGCGGSKHASGCTTANPSRARVKHVPKPTESLDPAKTYDVTMQTTCGSFTFQLDQKTSPHTTASFANLVHHGYFDGTIFHRIVPDFVIQGGDTTATGTGGPGYVTVDRPPASTRYVHGTVAMGKTAVQPPGTAGSQFFVVTAADAKLPPDYAVLGKVTSGLDVVDRIGKFGKASDPLGRPTTIVEIRHAVVNVR